MKNLFAGLLIAVTSFSSYALDVELVCKQTLNNESNATAGVKPFTLSTDGQNSKLISIFIGRDQNNSYLVSLNGTSSLCSIGDCTTVAAKNYTLTLVRVEDKVQQAQRRSDDRKLKIKGQTVSTVEFTKYVDEAAPMTSYYYKGETLMRGVTKLPESISLSYSVKDGLFRDKQKTNFECKIISVK
jgi:hypothetical protein